MEQGEGGRRGYTLIELVASMTAATLLMTGLASALLISSSAFQMDAGSQANKGAAAEIQADLTADLQHALSFSERADNAVTFSVPDRDGDSNPETIRYAWSGTLGDPLTYSYNGGTPVTIAEDVQSFGLNYLTRAEYPIYEGFNEAKLGIDGIEISVAKPAGTTTGDLLIAAVAIHRDTTAALAAPAGWNLIVVNHSGSSITLGVWWKIAQPSEAGSYVFNWTAAGPERAYAWIMRFTGHDTANPINASVSTVTGKTLSPPSPAVITNVGKTLILRLGGFHDDTVVVDSPGLPNHAVITMDISNVGGHVSGGAGYATSMTAGDSGASTFSLGVSKESVTVTIAIAPNQ